MILCTPPLEEEPWPTLGLQVCDFIEEYLIHGPGDIRGSPVHLNEEQRALICRMYEVYPRDHPQAGRRRFKRVGISQRKGVGKTEMGAWLAACELHPDAPMRCVDWDGHDNPIGGGVVDPWIFLVAYTEQQSEELAFGTLYVVLREGPLAGDFDIGLERIMRRGGDGRAVAVATAPNARDGSRVSFQLFDETGRFTLPRLKDAHRTMVTNIPKRKLADAWSLELTTAPAPGAGSIAEATMEYSRMVAEGKISDSRLFFFHRQASDKHDLTTEKGARAAVIEASGPTAEWSDIPSIMEQWRDPTTDRAYWERMWTNRLVRASGRAFDVEVWQRQARPDVVIPDGSLIVLGFDGSRREDATALVATDVASGYQWPLGIWEKPSDARDWSVPEEDVDATVRAAFARYDVWRMYADPWWWEGWLAQWSGCWGERVMQWATNRKLQMSHAIQSFNTALVSGELTHGGDEALSRHLGNAFRRELRIADAEGRPLWLIQKERHDSPHKIDAAMAAILSWEARTDAIAAGAKPGRSVYEDRDIRYV